MVDSPQPYAAHLRVGVHSWDVSSADDPDYGPLAGVRFTWQARQDDGWPTQHEPTVLVFGVIVEEGVDFSDVDQGTVVHFTFTPDGYASPLVEFGGTVRDLTAQPHSRGMVYSITAVDHLLALREKYTINAFIAAGSPAANTWTEPLQDAAGAGGGEGIRPALRDPFFGDIKPYTGGNGVTGDAITFANENAWDVLTGLLALDINRLGNNVANATGYRGILSYRLTAAGDLDVVQPYEGTWTPHGTDNAPLSLVDDPVVGWTDGLGNVDACTLRTDATVWSRERIEPNRAEFSSGIGAGIFVERPHTGPTITRYLDAGGPFALSDVTNLDWVISGIDNPNQWGTEWAMQAARDPDVVAGWFTLPTAMRVYVAAYGIDPRHTPDGSGRMAGLLGGASLVIPPGGDWQVRFRVRRALPDASDPYGIAVSADALAYSDLDPIDPTITYNDLDPALTYADVTLIGD